MNGRRVVVDELGISFQVPDKRMALGECKAGLLVWFADEALDVLEPPGAGLECLGASGVDGGGRVLFDQIAKARTQRLSQRTHTCRAIYSGGAS